MSYRPTGVDRDAYISGVRPGARFGVTHDVSKRRDCLPQNVYAYIRDSAELEERNRLVQLERNAVNRNMLASGKGNGKRMAGGEGKDVVAEATAMLTKQKTMERMEQLRILYAEEAAQWDVELAERGLALQRGGK